MRFCTSGTSSTGSATPRSPRATIVPSAAATTSCEVVHALAVLDLGDDRKLGAVAAQQLADALHVLGAAHEGGREVVGALLRRRSAGRRGPPRRGARGRAARRARGGPCGRRARRRAPPRSARCPRATASDAQLDAAVVDQDERARLHLRGQPHVGDRGAGAPSSGARRRGAGSRRPTRARRARPPRGAVRTSGPRVSSITATGSPQRRAASRTRAMRAACSAWLPWERFRRATLTPARIIASRVSSSSQAGPTVATTLVRPGAASELMDPPTSVSAGAHGT